MKNMHDDILETYFFSFLDRGFRVEETPLVTGLLDGRPLVEAISERFRITSDQAAAAIEAARQEVIL